MGCVELASTTYFGGFLVEAPLLDFRYVDVYRVCWSISRCMMVYIYVDVQV